MFLRQNEIFVMSLRDHQDFLHKGITNKECYNAMADAGVNHSCVGPVPNEPLGKPAGFIST